MPRAFLSSKPSSASCCCAWATPRRALGYLARSVELDPANAERVVRLTLAHGFRAERIREALPQSATTLTAMRLAFEHDGRERYLEWVETALDGATVAATDELLWAYADGALGIGQPARLAEHLNGWGPFDDVETESSRLMQHARASRHLGQPDQALAWARRAHALAPESQRAARLLGDVARAASRPDLAIEAYRHGLGLLARRNAAPRQRAFLYRRIGEAQEELNRADLAYDAYVKALELHPEEPHALRRTAALVGKKN